MNGKTYRIKNLDWERGEINPVIYAGTVFGQCQIWPDSASDGVMLFVIGGESIKKRCSTIQEAKDVAEAIILNKILNALEEV
jgi:hypothetical protein